jgi:hypothetical protein
MHFNPANWLYGIKQLVTGSDAPNVPGGGLPADGGFIKDVPYFLGDIVGAAGASGPSNSAMFYGLTAGTGNSTTTDYATTVAVKTSVGTGRVPFPRAGPNSGIASSTTSSGAFLIPAVGTYRVDFSVGATGGNQLQLELNGVDQFATVVGDNTSPNRTNGVSLITTVVPNSILAVINPAGNSPAFSITPANGATTHAEAQTLVITQLGIGGVSGPTFVAGAGLDSTMLVLQAAAGTTSIGTLLFPIPREYDEATNHFHVRLAAQMDGSTDAPTLSATLYRKRAGSSTTPGVTVNGTSDAFTGFVSQGTTALPLSSTEQVIDFNFGGLGLLRDDALTIVLSTGAHATNNIQVFFTEVSYRSCLVSYNETAGVGDTNDLSAELR